MKPYDEKTPGIGMVGAHCKPPTHLANYRNVPPEQVAVRGFSSLTLESAAGIANFIQAIQEEREPLAGIDLAVDCVSVNYAAYQSGEGGRTIQLEVASPNPLK
ncbi:hypothetical protein [Cyclobacterium roseum]|uniref:hypothetical protein n=1 Tax=Cyclobacterium roseum TaxID=2666137 RepID=UPI001390891E|nr:hypothetical protein [Cyclobacterium roseum]